MEIIKYAEPNNNEITHIKTDEIEQRIYLIVKSVELYIHLFYIEKDCALVSFVFHSRSKKENRKENLKTLEERMGRLRGSVG